MSKSYIVKLKGTLGTDLEIKDSKFGGQFGTVSICITSKEEQDAGATAEWCNVSISERQSGYLKRLSESAKKGELVEIVCWEDHVKKVVDSEIRSFVNYKVTKDATCSVKVFKKSEKPNTDMSDAMKIEAELQAEKVSAKEVA